MFYKVFFYLFILIFLLTINAFASEKILGLYKSTDNSTEKNNPILNFLSQPLKELGYEVDYRDVLLPFPSSQEMKQYKAVVTFYFNPVHPDAKGYIKWLDGQINDGKKVIIFGNFGAYSSDGVKWLTNEELNDFFFLFGLSLRGFQKTKPEDLKVKYKDPLIMPSIPTVFPENFIKIDSINKNNKVYLKLSSGNEDESSIVVKTPFGGMAPLGYIYTQNNNGTIEWNLDRKNFLRNVLSFDTAVKPSEKFLLGLYKSSENDTEINNLIKKFAAEPLFKLGYKMDYLDIDKGIPDDKTMEKYSGIISWYRGPEMYRASLYCRWLADRISKGKRVIILGNFGAYGEKIREGDVETMRFLIDKEYNNFFYPFGLIMDKLWTSDPNLISCDYIDENIINKEFLKDGDFKNYFRFKSVNKDNKSYITLHRKDIKNSGSNIVVTTPYGGMALEGYIYRQDEKWNVNYILNLDKFFSEALKERDFIAPETFCINVDPEKELSSSKNKHIFQNGPANCETPLPRRILVLYKGSEETDCLKTPFYTYTGAVANYLGLIPIYLDIEKDRPDDRYMEDFSGIITWFTSPGMKDVYGYDTWITRQIKNGKKLVVLGDYGAFYEFDTYKDNIKAKDFFKLLGLELPTEDMYIKEYLKFFRNELLTSIHHVNVFATFQPITYDYGRPDRNNAFYSGQRLIKIDNNYFNFEEHLDEKNINPIMVKSTEQNNKKLMELYVTDLGEVVPAVITPEGGALLGDFFYKISLDKEARIDVKNYNDLFKINYEKDPTTTNNGRWIVNPFLFLTETLELENIPKPDYTTLNGQRIFYSHLDGDGLVNLAYIPTNYSGEIIKKEIFEKYNLPFSVSVITEEMEKYGEKYYNRPMIMAREIFALNNVEVATHSHTHPYDLQNGDLQVGVNHEDKKDEFNIEFKKTDPEKEILYSTALINQNLVPPEKKVSIVFWPGKCNPTEEFVKMADMLGLENINGGDPIYDEEHKSYSNLCQIFVNRGNAIQVRTSGSNDYLYTDSWTKNYGEMKKLINHIKCTDKPLRISPINVYYHFYSGMYDDGVEALKAIYDYCLEKPLAPLFASQYSLIVKDFYHTRIGSTGDGGFIINNMGYLRTVRFDNTKLMPDLSRCEHIMGYDYYNNSLYVFLDEEKEHKIYLTSEEQKNVYLKSGSHYIEKWQNIDGKITAVVKGIGPGYMEIANLKPRRLYSVIIGDLKEEFNADSSGLLKFKYELKGKPRDYNLEVLLK